MTLNISTQSAVGQNMLESLAQALAAKAKEMGLMFSVWDNNRAVYGPDVPNIFIEMIYHSEGRGITKRRENLAAKVCETAQPARTQSRFGCEMIGIPVFDRRRPIGAIILEYPPLEMSEEEALCRICSQAKLDAPVMADYATVSCRYKAIEAEHLQNIFNDLLLEQIYTFEAHDAVVSLSSNLANTYEELSLLYRVSGSMMVSMEPKPFLTDLCQQLCDVMKVEHTVAIITDPDLGVNSGLIVQAGESELEISRVEMLNQTYIIPQLGINPETLLNNNVQELNNLVLGKHVANYLAAPMKVDNKIIGTIISINKYSGDFNSSDIKLINSIASQTSVFLGNHKMYAELEELLTGVLQSLTESIDAKDPYTCGHSRRVASMAYKLAVGYGLPAERCRQIYYSGLLHDVGKIGVPEAILCKNGRLTNEEFENIKRHPAIGAKILRRIRNLEPIIAGVLTHHERIDGRGYPNQLTGEEIPIEGRIICIADSWDAMTSHRTYRKALDLDRAIEQLTTNKGTQFDAELVDIFLSWDIDKLMMELHSENQSDLHLLDEKV